MNSCVRPRRSKTSGPRMANDRQDGLLSEARLRKALGERPFQFLKQVGSTNDLAREWALKGAWTGSVVGTEEQITVRGRFGRSWSAPPVTTLLVSVIVGPRIA